MSKAGNKQEITAVTGLMIAALLALLYLIFVSPGKFISDERDFMPNISVLRQYGFSLGFLRNIRGQSPGPLYQYIYYPVSCIIPLSPHNARLVNFCFLAGITWLLYLLVKPVARQRAWAIALLLPAIPMTWVIAGMAFTEMPSLFCCMLALALLSKALEGNGGRALLFAALGGLAAGAAIIGRSPFLMLLPAAAALYLLPGRRAQVSLFLLCALLFPAIVFYAWQGLVPPDVQNIQAGYQPAYLLLCFVYAGIATLIVCPSLYRIGRVHYFTAAGIFITALLLNTLVTKIPYTPMNGVLTMKVIPAVILRIYPYLFPAAVCGCSYLFAAALALHILRRRPHAWQLFLLSISLLIMLTTIKSAAHFNSKYVIQAYPFLLLYLAGDIKINKALFVRALLGIIVGIMSLHSYYAIHAALPYQ